MSYPEAVRRDACGREKSEGRTGVFDGAPRAAKAKLVSPAVA